MPTHLYQAQPQQPMPTYGYPATTYPASAYPNAQYQAPQATHAQDTTPQPPMQYYGAAYGLPLSLNSSGPLRPQPNGVEHLLPDPVSHREEVSEEGEVLE
jgi:hypothetical protein